MSMNVGIYGVGHFGYAILHNLATNAKGRFSIRAYDREERVRAALRQERRHPIHEAMCPLPADVSVVDSPDGLAPDLDALILAVTSDSTRDVVSAIGNMRWERSLLIVNTAKALDFQTGHLLGSLIAEILDASGLNYIYAALAGGTIAADLLRQDPLGVSIGCDDEAGLRRACEIFSSSSMRVDPRSDVVGVECAGAFKNVISICAGMVHGLGFSYGAETHLISRMAAEVEDFSVKRMGASRSTFSMESQCWGNDLWMSCTGKTRNRAFGKLLGRGLSMETAITEMSARHKTVEGVQTIRAMSTLLGDYPDDLPLFRVAESILLGGAPPRLLIDALMRDVSECDSSRPA